MRFAYIDSNGNEVPIPSVDALALRIELGAISEDTQLYDAQADQWGPAHTHEIYHTLARASGSDDGFVAPPPVAPPPVAPPEAPVAEPPVAVEELAVEEIGEAVQEPSETAPAPTESASDSSGGLEAADLGLTLAEPPVPEEGEDVGLGLDLDLAEGDDGGLTLAEPSETADDLPGTVPAEDAPMDFGGLDLAPAPEEAGESPDVTPVDGVIGAAAPESVGTFDFGGMEGGLELEETFDAPEESAPMDFTQGVTDEVAADFGGGMELETTMDFGSGGFEMDSGGGLDLETPMSEFSPEDPPAWMDGDGESAGQADVLDFSSVGGESEADVPLRDRRTPVNKPSPPKRRRRSLTGPLIGGVLVVALGVGVRAAWPVVSARLAAGPSDGELTVFIPPISAELMPQMRDAAEAALAATFDDVRQGSTSGGAAMAPPSEWLAGVYLARASEYEEAEAFWDGMAELLDGARAIQLTDFDAAFAAEMSAREVATADAEAMRARADSGFVAAADAREEAYAQMGTLIAAAIRLHQFLVANEANIEYAPASAVTTDPVLEVRPASEEIGDAMGELIEAVTGALGALGYRDQVTADGLWNLLLTRVQETGIQ